MVLFSLPEGTNLPSGVTATDVTQLGDNFGGGAGTQPRSQYDRKYRQRSPPIHTQRSNNFMSSHVAGRRRSRASGVVAILERGERRSCQRRLCNPVSPRVISAGACQAKALTVTDIAVQSPLRRLHQSRRGLGPPRSTFSGRLAPTPAGASPS